MKLECILYTDWSSKRLWAQSAAAAAKIEGLERAWC